MEQPKKGRDIDQAQELSIAWLKEYWDEQKNIEAPEEDKAPEQEQPTASYDFKLAFDDLDIDDIDNPGIEPDMQNDYEDMDMEYD